jgi:hypothetical protein
MSEGGYEPCLSGFLQQPLQDPHRHIRGDAWPDDDLMNYVLQGEVVCRHTFNRVDFLLELRLDQSEDSLRDSLTGTHNRRYFSRSLEVLIEDARHTSLPLRTYEDWHSCVSRMIHDLGRALRDHQCVAAAVALRVNLTFMGSLERAITNTGLFLPVVQLPVS